MKSSQKTNLPKAPIKEKQIEPSKNKKLINEYAKFDLKVAYFLVQSTYTGKQFSRNETEPTFTKLPDNEQTLNTFRFESLRENPTLPSIMTINRWNEHFQNFYTLFKQINLGLDADKPKRNLLVRLKEMFDDFHFDASIVIYSGPATIRGNLLLESRESGAEEITFTDIANEWSKRTSSQKHLLIILDSNYSGKWAKELSNNKNYIDSISIFASTAENEKGTYFELGGYFTYNVMKLLNKNQTENLVPLVQNPQFGGNYLLCKKYTNLYLNFNSWQQIALVQKSDYANIEYDNGTYTGHMEGGQKNYWGTFIWKTGTFKNCKYSGEFEKGKLHNKGIMMYVNGRVYEGDFKNNAPDGNGIETYENGDKYVGKYSKGFKSGQGVYFYANGEKYEGVFFENKPHGKGKLTMPKGAVYEGQFKNGRCNGIGVYKYENGDVYTGEWSDSIKHGKGVYKYANGDVFEGQFINGIRHGIGKLKMVSGEIYEGGWDNDLMHGEGKYTSSGDVVRGEWMKGKLTKQPEFFQKSGTQRISLKN